jgi:hypothetical protein
MNMGQSNGLGRLKLAEQMIKQRQAAAGQAIANFIDIEYRKQLETLNAEFKMPALKQSVFDAQTKINGDLAKLKNDHTQDCSELRNEITAEQAKLNQSYEDKLSKLRRKYEESMTKLRADELEARQRLSDTESKRDAELTKRHLALNEKGTMMHTELAHSTQVAIDKLYEAELGPELKAVVDGVASLADLANSVPRLGKK